MDIKGKPTDVNTINGVIPPQITKNQLCNKFYTSTGYSDNQQGALVYVTDSSLPSNVTDIMQTEEIKTAGVYVFDGIKWKSVSSTISKLAVSSC